MWCLCEVQESSCECHALARSGNKGGTIEAVSGPEWPTLFLGASTAVSPLHGLLLVLLVLLLELRVLLLAAPF